MTTECKWPACIDEGCTPLARQFKSCYAQDHLRTLRVRLSKERNRLAESTSPTEANIRSIWVAQCEREVAAELKFLGLPDDDTAGMSADELFRELGGGDLAGPWPEPTGKM